MTHYYCAKCSARLKPGDGICVCGQVFDHPVPPLAEDVGIAQVLYWPPRTVSTSEAVLKSWRQSWESIDPMRRAIGLGIPSVLGIVIVVFFFVYSFNWRDYGTKRTSPTATVQIQPSNGTSDNPGLEHPQTIQNAAPSPNAYQSNGPAPGPANNSAIQSTSTPANEPYTSGAGNPGQSASSQQQAQQIQALQDQQNLIRQQNCENLCSQLQSLQDDYATNFNKYHERLMGPPMPGDPNYEQEEAEYDAEYQRYKSDEQQITSVKQQLAQLNCVCAQN